MKIKISALVGLFIIACTLQSAWAEEKVHIIKKGDTLWDISEQYLNTPWEWPLVWSNNQVITNPHFIYPGDKVIITKENGKTVIKIIPAGKSEDDALIYTPEQIAKAKDNSILLAPRYATLNYSDSLITGDGKVIGKYDGGTMASLGETVAIKTAATIKPGQIIPIMAKIYEINIDEETKNYVYDTIALAEAISQEGELLNAKIIYASQEIEAGNIILNAAASIKPREITLTAPTLAQEGQIIDLLGVPSAASATDVIFINIGSNQGATAGAMVDIYKEISFADEGLSTRQYKGVGLILTALENTSMCLVNASQDVIRKGYTITASK